MSAMTEDEARKRWCPFARHQSHPYEAGDGRLMVTVTTNREPMHFREPNVVADTALNCIASECMAWRWHPTTKARMAEIKRVREERGCSLTEAIQLAKLAYGAIGEDERDIGYCGLAGPVTP